MLDECFSSFFKFGRYLSQPNERFNSFQLTEKWASLAKIVMPPVLQENFCFRCNLPVSRIFQISPIIHLYPKIINDRRWVIFLRLCRYSSLVAKLNLDCSTFFRFSSFGFRNRRYELSTSPTVNDFICGLPIIVQFPVH